MNNILNTSFLYSILAMIGGVFYREFTKYNNFNGKTTLAFVHVHLFILGMFMFLIIALFNKTFNLINHKLYKTFYILYNLGLSITVITFIWRGILQTLNLTISKAMSSSISGIAGLGHILLGTGIIILFTILKHCALVEESNK